MTSNRLALLVNVDGTRWVTTFREGDPVKHLMRGGRQYTCIMTMDTKHADWAQAWLWEAPNATVKVTVAPNVTATDIAA
jgi:phage/plasmid primase-like uncharacterized protein